MKTEIRALPGGGMRSKMNVFGRIWITTHFAIVGCQHQQQDKHIQPRENGAQTSPAGLPEATNARTDHWLGKWIGPEGTFLELSKHGNKYVLKINSLDGPATYEGISVGDHIEFQRDGRNESIHAGNGVDTDMKWLLDKKNCLFIKKGQGFCR
jgi:hypothetical protein